MLHLGFWRLGLPVQATLWGVSSVVEDHELRQLCVPAPTLDVVTHIGRSPERVCSSWVVRRRQTQDTTDGRPTIGTRYRSRSHITSVPTSSSPMSWTHLHLRRWFVYVYYVFELYFYDISTTNINLTQIIFFCGWPANHIMIHIS